jgi:RNA polymerase sigma factor (sigma-70 family)
MAMERFRRRPEVAEDDREARVAAVVSRHLPALLRVARRVSLCADDAQDAVQRALEIYVRRLDGVDTSTEVAWLKVVVRHEALAIRRARAESVAVEEVDFDAHAAGQRGVDDAVAGSERVRRSAEALRALKRDEATALLLKAQGHSYAEIGERQGWTYTKVNRAITEGRKRFLEVYAELESGEACERVAPVLAVLAAGEAESAQLVAVRAHLRHCASCRAVVRALHGTGRPRASALLPLPALLAALRWLRDRFGEPAERVQHALHRLGGSDVATGVQLSAGSGGGRGAAIAALIGVCLSGAGAGTYCIVTDTLPSPTALVRPADPDRDRTKPRRSRTAPTPAPTSTPPATDLRAATAMTPTPTATPGPRPTPRPASTPTPRARATPPPASTSQTAQAQDEFGFEAGGSSTAPAPKATTASAARSTPTAPRKSRPATTSEFGFE